MKSLFVVLAVALMGAWVFSVRENSPEGATSLQPPLGPRAGVVEVDSSDDELVPVPNRSRTVNAGGGAEELAELPVSPDERPDPAGETGERALGAEQAPVDFTIAASEPFDQADLDQMTKASNLSIRKFRSDFRDLSLVELSRLRAECAASAASQAGALLEERMALGLHATINQTVVVDNWRDFPPSTKDFPPAYRQGLVSVGASKEIPGEWHLAYLPYKEHVDLYEWHWKQVEVENAIDRRR